MSDDVVWMEQKRVMQNCFKLDSSPSQTGMNMNIISIFTEWFKQLSKGQAGKASKCNKRTKLYQICSWHIIIPCPRIIKGT